MKHGRSRRRHVRAVSWKGRRQNRQHGRTRAVNLHLPIDLAEFLDYAAATEGVTHSRQVTEMLYCLVGEPDGRKKG